VERAIELVPENYSFLAARYTILAQKGDHERAAADMRTIADHADEYVHQLAATARLAGVALPTLAAAAGPPSLPSAAGQSWLELAVANPDAAVRAVRVAADAVEAVSLMARGDLERARSRYRHALELDPDQSVVWTAKAELELQLGNLEDARADFDRAVETGPDNPQAWRNRARFRLSQQSLDDALMDIDRAIELAPTDYTLISVRALIFQAGGALAGFAECARILAEHAEEYVDQVAAGARMAPAGARLARRCLRHGRRSGNPAGALSRRP
jgi:tetratricopeptide (TPR) repeat protein